MCNTLILCIRSIAPACREAETEDVKSMDDPFCFDDPLAAFAFYKWMEYLVDKDSGKPGTHPGSRDENGNTPLLIAAQRGYAQMVKKLLEQGADVDARNDYGTTALMFASDYGHAEIVRILLDHGATVNLKDVRGHTALMFAANKGYEEIVEMLLEAGADAGIKDREGHTAIYFAEGSGHKKIAELLKGCKQE